MLFEKRSINVMFGLANLLACSGLYAATVVDLSEQKNSILGNFVIQTENSKTASFNQHENTLVKLALNQDRKGTTHGRYQQYYRGIPVWGYHVLTHQKGNAPRQLGGHLIEGIDQDVPASALAKKFDASAMLDKMKKQFIASSKQDTPEWTFSNEKAEVVYFIDENQKARLAYVVNFFADSSEEGTPSRPFYIIDAENGKVLQEWDGLTYQKKGTGPGGNDKIGAYKYGTDYDFLDITISGASCTLENENVRTIHMKNRRFGNKVSHKFSCFEQRGDSINGAFSPLNDAHFFGGVVFNMYGDWYQIKPITQKLSLRAHYGNSFENAFWDGQQMTFGDGANRFYPLVSLDVVAHEVSHGVTEQNSNLTYSGQSGGINEAFSDMAGKTAEFYMRGANTWNIGSDITKKGNGLRYMDEPTKDGKSIDDARNYTSSLDVHYSSGVFNKAFYLLSTTEGWDIHKAFDVMLYANQHYWTPNSTFIDAATGVVSAAKDLGYDADAVAAAFTQVGISCQGENGCTLAQ
jgi:Zn-dependent metalloprotease